jgi:hypothetical protein
LRPRVGICATLDIPADKKPKSGFLMATEEHMPRFSRRSFYEKGGVANM